MDRRRFDHPGRLKSPATSGPGGLGLGAGEHARLRHFHRGSRGERLCQQQDEGKQGRAHQSMRPRARAWFTASTREWTASLL